MTSRYGRAISRIARPCLHEVTNRMLLRRLSIAIALLALADARLGGATTLGGNAAKGLASGRTTVVSCDTNGMTASPTISGGVVTAVTIGGISDPACEGGRLSITVTGSGEAQLAAGGPLTIPADGDVVDNAVSVPLAATVDPAVLAATYVSVVAP